MNPRRAVVTGVSRRTGIGAAVARTLAADGWDLTLTGWRPYDETMPWGSIASEVDELVAELTALGAAVTFLEVDLSRPDAPRAVFERSRSAPSPTTGLVVVHTHDTGGGLLEVTAEDIDLHLAINVRATMLLAAEFARQFTGPHGSGRIVTFTSGLPLTGSVAYAASKGAIEWMTVSAAAELADRGITVNAVNPGPNDTGWMPSDLRDRVQRSSPLGRAGSPQDAANLVAFLCSDAGSWITGEVINSDGGWSKLRG